MPTKHAVVFGGRRDPCACQLLSTDDFDAISSFVQRIDHVVHSVVILVVATTPTGYLATQLTNKFVSCIREHDRPRSHHVAFTNSEIHPRRPIPGQTNPILTGAFSDLITGFALRNEVTSHMGCSRPFGVAPAVEEFASSIRRTLSGNLAKASTGNPVHIDKCWTRTGRACPGCPGAAARRAGDSTRSSGCCGKLRSTGEHH